jgi:hypothetical protein
VEWHVVDAEHFGCPPASKPYGRKPVNQQLYTRYSTISAR